MQAPIRSLLTITAAILGSAKLHAQTITPLIVEGDSAAWGTNIVDRIENVDVNDRGDWLAEASADPTNGSFMINLGVVHNGTLMYAEGTNTGFPASHSGWQMGAVVDSMEINDSGDILVLMRVEDSAGILPGRSLLLWTNGVTGITYPLLETEVTPTDTMVGEPLGSEEPAGAVWSTVIRAWQNNNHQLVLRGTSDADTNDMLVLLEHDGAGTITSQTMIAVEGVRHDQAFPPASGVHNNPATGFSYRKVELAFNNAGQTMFFVDDAETTPADADEDSHYYVDSQEVLWEADLSPSGNGTTYRHLSNAEVDINDTGSWAAVMQDEGPSASNPFIVVDGAVYLSEGDPVPGLDPMLGYTLTSTNFGPIQISDFGGVTWLGRWDDPNPDVDSGLFHGDALLVQEGVTQIGGRTVTEISPAHDGMAASDSGQFIIVELKTDAIFGPDIEGAYLLDLGTNYPSFCDGDGGDQVGCTPCPCANNAAPGSPGGCINSAGTSSYLTVSGDSSVSLPAGSNLDLRFELSGAPARAFCVLTSADSAAPSDMANPCFGLNSGIQSLTLDGLVCATGNMLRHGGRSADLSGRVGVISGPWGGEGNPAAGIAAAAGLMAGQTRYFQVQHRDNPAMICGRGMNSSQAIQVNLTP